MTWMSFLSYLTYCLNLQIHTDSDDGDGNIKYTISGEGAGSIFIIDEQTGDIHATERLDREEKASYTLKAQARDELSNDPLEPESEFVIKVQDINDSEPKFTEGPYIGSVAELSPIGKIRTRIVQSDRSQLGLRLWTRDGGDVHCGELPVILQPFAWCISKGLLHNALSGTQGREESAKKSNMLESSPHCGDGNRKSRQEMEDGNRCGVSKFTADEK